MIYIVTTNKKKYTLEPFFNDWVPETKAFIEHVTYEWLLDQNVIKKGVYIFTDIDVLSVAMFRFVSGLAEKIEKYFGQGAVLNHPAKVLQRFELLSRLRREGINNFSVYPASRITDVVNFPVFLRKKNDHRGPLTGLLQTPEELKSAVKKLLVEGKNIADIMIVEFCDSKSEDGFYRKYSVFVFNGEIIPRHLAFSKNWVVKLRREGNLFQLKQERKFLSDNPHLQQLGAVLKIAGIDYGRIDYGLKNKRIQVWEINLNPYLLKKKALYDDIYMSDQETFCRQIVEKLRDTEKNTLLNNSEIPKEEIKQIRNEYMLNKIISEIRETIRKILPNIIFGNIAYYRSNL